MKITNKQLLYLLDLINSAKISGVAHIEYRIDSRDLPVDLEISNEKWES